MMILCGESTIRLMVWPVQGIAPRIPVQSSAASTCEFHRALKLVATLVAASLGSPHSASNADFGDRAPDALSPPSHDPIEWESRMLCSISVHTEDLSVAADGHSMTRPSA
jgi:hypothetical protein